MAKEIKAPGLDVGATYFAIIQNPAGLYWTGTGNNFAAANTITWTAAAVALSADATVTNYYSADFPTAITTAGVYLVEIYQQAGGSPALSDVIAGLLAEDTLNWNGTTEIILGDNWRWLGQVIPAPANNGIPTVDAQNLMRKVTTAQGGSLSTITLDALANATDQFYRGARVVIKSGTGLEQERIITNYVGATKVATVAPNWTVAPDNTSVIFIAPGSADVESIANNSSAVALTGGLLNVNAPTGGLGTGDKLVTQNQGGAGNLKPTIASIGQPNVTVSAYLQSDFTAGNRTLAYVKDQKITNSSGDWPSEMHLAAGTYAFTFDDNRASYPAVQNVVVS